MVVNADLNGVLICFNPLKDLLAEQVVTGNVQRILIKVLILGNIELIYLIVRVGLEGRLASPSSFNCFCHFSCQQCSSLSMHSGDGKSLSYNSTSGFILELFLQVKERPEQKALLRGLTELFADVFQI